MPLRVQFAHGEIFDQPLLYFFEAVMIAIENLLRLVEIEVVFTQFRPRQLRDRLHIADDDGIFRARRRDDIEPLQFAIGRRENFRRRLRFVETGAQLRDLFVRAGIAFAELALNRLQLAAQVGLALRVAEL